MYSKNINKKYSDIIKKNPLLSRKEEYNLAKKLKEGDLNAREKLIASNYRLVISIARKYHRNNINFDDLLQESSIGLIKAVDKFDPDLGYKFSTYASWWIKQAALQYINESLTDVKVPTHSRLLNAKIKKCKSDLENKLGREPTIKEISLELDIPEKKIKYTLKANDVIISLDKDIKDSEKSVRLKDTLEDKSSYVDPEKQMLSKELNELIKKSLSLLTPKEEKILRLRFGIGEDENDNKNFPITDEMNYLNDDLT